MGDVVKLKSKRSAVGRARERPRSDAIWEREKRLRIVAKKLGYELVRPWCAEKRNIPGHGRYPLVQHVTGLSIAVGQRQLVRLVAGARSNLYRTRLHYTRAVRKQGQIKGLQPPRINPATSADLVNGLEMRQQSCSLVSGRHR
jgi:hypothetical protein